MLSGLQKVSSMGCLLHLLCESAPPNIKIQRAGTSMSEKPRDLLPAADLERSGWRIIGALQVIGWEAAIGGAEAPQQADVASKVLAHGGSSQEQSGAANGRLPAARDGHRLGGYEYRVHRHPAADPGDFHPARLDAARSRLARTLAKTLSTGGVALARAGVDRSLHRRLHLARPGGAPGLFGAMRRLAWRDIPMQRFRPVCV